MNWRKARGILVIVCGSAFACALFAAVPLYAQDAQGEPDVSSAPAQPAQEPLSATKEPPTLPKPKSDPPPPQPSLPPAYVQERTRDSADENLAVKFFQDQEQIWTSPAKLRLSDASWIVPLSGIGTALFATDQEFSSRLSTDPTTIRHYKSFSNLGAGALVGSAGGLWLLGHVRHNDHWTETGFLSGEAALNSLIAVETLKYSLRRSRPFQADGTGQFFSPGSTSFPSEHAAAAFAIAGVIAHEYHGFLPKFLAYGLATGVAFSRVKSKQHFSSDVFVGGLLGQMVAQNIYTRRSDPSLGGGEWRSFRQFFRDRWESAGQNTGSSYVPLDSWVYPAIERLNGMGLVNSAYAGLKPWTRSECTRFTEEAQEALQADDASNPRVLEAQLLLKALHREFFPEYESSGEVQHRFEIDSIYARFMSVSGPVLTDGYHFGQTFAYDFGRPFRRGFDEITGTSFHAEFGSLFFYARGEFQHAPGAPALSSTELQFISQHDQVPLESPSPFAPVNRFRLLDSYLGWRTGNWQLTFGNQSLTWGPGAGGSLLLSDNAEPIPMLRIAPVEPFVLPVLKFLGPAKFEQFYGRLNGHTGDSQPWIYGQKVSFKPSRSFEFSYGRTSLIGGTGHPLTSGNFFRSLFGRVYSATGSVPGDSRTSFDWTWRVPGTADSTVFYGELEDDDDLIPFQNLTKTVFRPGIYFTRLPLLPEWDLHFEYTNSETPGRKSYQASGDLNYWNQDYRDGYTNFGELMGNVVGREGKTLQAWSRWWISPRKTLDLSWKRTKVLGDYVPGGADWQDFSATHSITLSAGAYFKTMLQLEHISKYPLLFTGPQNNVVASIEIGFLPGWSRHGRGTASSRETSGENSP
jgi:membrane-associated phospholipid phosphatase